MVCITPAESTKSLMALLQAALRIEVSREHAEKRAESYAFFKKIFTEHKPVSCANVNHSHVVIEAFKTLLAQLQEMEIETGYSVVAAWHILRQRIGRASGNAVPARK